MRDVKGGCESYIDKISGCRLSNILSSALLGGQHPENSWSSPCSLEDAHIFLESVTLSFAKGLCCLRDQRGRRSRRFEDLLFDMSSRSAHQLGEAECCEDAAVQRQCVQVVCCTLHFSARVKPASSATASEQRPMLKTIQSVPDDNGTPKGYQCRASQTHRCVEAFMLSLSSKTLRLMSIKSMYQHEMIGKGACSCMDHTIPPLA